LLHRAEAEAAKLLLKHRLLLKLLLQKLLQLLKLLQHQQLILLLQLHLQLKLLQLKVRLSNSEISEKKIKPLQSGWFIFLCHTQAPGMRSRMGF
jgi:hypothetical protein